MGYFVNPVLAELRPELVQRVASGELVRHGGVLRWAAHHPSAGRIAAHLREVPGASPATLIDPPLPISATLRLANVAAAAGVLNLGVSVAGFAIIAHRIGRLQSSVNELLAASERRHAELSGVLLRLSDQLVELRLLALEHRDVTDAILDEVRQARRDLVDSYIARVLTEVGLLQRSPTIDGARAEQALRTFAESRRWFEQTMERGGAWLDRLVRFRGWCMASACELALLRRVGEDRGAARLARELATSGRRIASSWRDELLPSAEFGGVFRYSHSRFGRLPREVYERLVRLHDGTILVDSDRRELQSRIAVAEQMPRLGDAWVDQQIAVASMLDFVEETTARVESTADALEMCADEELRYRDWEALEAPPTAMGLCVVEVQQ